ncbi:MAG: hypothetical protein IT477_10545 [Rhodanobacteraceae bacterium]|nr:hypothetical protein [Rhodanobacteraceae bacterium]
MAKSKGEAKAATPPKKTSKAKAHPVADAPPTAPAAPWPMSPIAPSRHVCGAVLSEDDQRMAQETIQRLYARLRPGLRFPSVKQALAVIEEALTLPPDLEDLTQEQEEKLEEAMEDSLVDDAHDVFVDSMRRAYRLGEASS